MDANGFATFSGRQGPIEWASETEFLVRLGGRFRYDVIDADSFRSRGIRKVGIGISNTLFHDFAMYRSLPEGASAKKFLPPRCVTKFSPLKECDVHPAGTDTRASGRAGSPALAKAHWVKDQAAWNRSARCAAVGGSA